MGLAVVRVMKTIVIAAITTLVCGSARAESALSIVPSGLTVQLGGGVSRFAGKEAKDLFHPGGYWDLRAVWGSSSLLGAELSYRASTNNGKAGPMGGAQLFGDGAEAAARINLPLHLDRLRLTPFACAGVGWTYYQLQDAPSSSPQDQRHASALVLPVGAGIGGVIEHVTVDLRLTYRATHASQRFTAGGTEIPLQSWSAGLTVGYEI
jgi:hypothetical protein